MGKYILAIWILGTLFLSSTAQNTFEITLPSLERGTSVDGTADGGLIISGERGSLFRLDESGKQVWRKQVFSTNTYIKRIRTLADGGFAIAASEFTAAPTLAVFARLTPDASFIFKTEVKPSDFGRTGDDIALMRQGFALGTYDNGSGNDNKFEVINVDAGGTRIARSPVVQIKSSAGRLLIDKDGYAYVISSVTDESKEGNSDVLLSKISPTGIMLWSKKYGSGVTEIATGIAFSEKYGLVASVGTIDLDNNQRIKLFYFNLEGDSLLVSDGGPGYPMGVVTYDNNVFWVGANDAQAPQVEGFGVTLNSYNADGIQLTRKRFQRDGFSIRIYDFQALKDSTIALVGAIHRSDLADSLYIIKTLPNGDIVTNVATNSLLDSEFKVYPNPFKSEVNVVIPSRFLKDPTDLEFIFYNSLGQKIIQQNQIANGQFQIKMPQPLATGVYLYELRKGDEILSTGKLLTE